MQIKDTVARLVEKIKPAFSKVTPDKLVYLIIGAFLTMLVNQIPSIISASKSLQTLEFTYRPQLERAVALETNEKISCWASGSADRVDAFRCSVGSELRDPCFMAPESYEEVMCPVSPKLHGESFTPDSIDVNSVAGQGSPWYLELEDGDTCKFINGAGIGISGQRANYYCQSGTTLFGAIDRTDDAWRIGCENLDKNRIEDCRIREAWN